MQYTLVLINRIQRLATLYMIFVGSALKNLHSTKLFNTKHHILINCSRKIYSNASVLEEIVIYI